MWFTSPIVFGAGWRVSRDVVNGVAETPAAPGSYRYLHAGAFRNPGERSIKRVMGANAAKKPDNRARDNDGVKNPAAWFSVR
jgi:hypothetical protein